LPFNNSEFDLILAFGILHHIPSINKALAEIVRVMKVNGLFIFRDPCSENPMVWLKYKLCHKSANEFPISRKDIKVAFRATGMSIVYLNRFWLRFPWLPAGLWSVNLGGVARKI
jgi:SAM-dependent methyltransferase